MRPTALMQAANRFYLPHFARSLPPRTTVTIGIILTVAVLSLPSAAQTTRYVSPSGDDAGSACTDTSAPCRSIGGALAVANSGDTIAVSAGVFYESELVVNRDVVITGSGAQDTIIDGDGQQGPRAQYLAAVRTELIDVVSTAEFSAGKSGGTLLRSGAVSGVLESSHQTWYGSAALAEYILHIVDGVSAEIHGVTLRDGGRLSSAASSGGIVNDGTLRIIESKLEHNVAFGGDQEHPEEGGRGGAIRNSGELILERTEVRRNIAVGGGTQGGRGGGIFNEGGVSLLHSTLEKNETWDVQEFCEGGGLWNGGEAEVVDSRVINNRSDCFEGGAGGGLYNGGVLRVERSIIAGNSAVSHWEYAAGFGGGIASVSTVTVVNSTVSRNTSGLGGGIYTEGSADVFSASIVENDATDREYVDGRGGGMHASGDLTLWNSIIFGNRAGEDATSSSADCAGDAPSEAAFLLTGSDTGCPDSVIQLDAGTTVDDLFDAPEEPEAIDYAYVPRLATGPIDRGDCSGPGGDLLSTDQLGNARPFDDPGIDDLSDGCDIGAVELQEGSDQHSSGSVLAAEDSELPHHLELDQNYPNPFNGSTNITFTVPQTSHAELVVYDVTGREVARLVDDSLPRGHYDVKWGAQGLSSGTYLYRLTVGTRSAVRFMAIAK